MVRTKWLAVRMAFGALALFGLSAGASAGAPVLNGNDKIIVNHLSGTFSEAISLDIPLPDTYLVDVHHNGGPDVFESLALKVFSGNDTSGPLLGSINGEGAFSFWADRTGPYTALLFGEKLKLHGGGTLAISVTPVPEPETWLMMLAGMGLIAATSLSRRKATGEGRPGIA